MLSSDRVLAIGDTGSGKSHFLRTQLLPRYARAIILDVTGEMWQRRGELGGRVVIAETADEVVSAVAKLAREQRWRVVATLGEAETWRLVPYLVPERIATAPSLVRAVGGLALYCDELEQVAPKSSPEVVNGLWNRGRHVGLSVLGATQYPASVKPLVRGASRFHVVGQVSEPRTISYLSECGYPPPVMEWIERLDWQQLVVIDTRKRVAHLLSRDYRPLASWAARPADSERAPSR